MVLNLFHTMPTSIFEVMSMRARESGAINLGQGFPDEQGPEDLRRIAADGLMTGSNQYPPMRGLPELRQAVGDHYRRFQHLDLAADQVVVTSGATEAIAASLLAFVQPGDEVVIFEPAYDAYRPLIERAGGVVSAVQLAPPSWRIEEAAIEAVVGPHTRAIVFNNPHNPTGRAFDADEVAAVARVAARHDLIAISDEVWEHIQFDGRVHRPLIAEPGMAERCIKIGSAGKIFSMTGWKVGFAMAAPALIDPVMKAHQFLAFATAPHLQAAVAVGLGWDEQRFSEMRSRYQASRDRLASGLEAAGYKVTPAEATYFLCIDLAASGITEDDRAFCDRLVSEHGVAAIPVSAFFAEGGPSNIVRLCFAKADTVLDEAVARMAGALP